MSDRQDTSWDKIERDLSPNVFVSIAFLISAQLPAVCRPSWAVVLYRPQASR